MDTEVLSMRKLKNKSVGDNSGIMVWSSKKETSDVRVKDVDVSDTDTDSDSVESYEEQVPNNTKGSTARSSTFDGSCFWQSMA